MTRYIYPSHLSQAKERFALGVVRDDELRRIMRHPPGYILMEAVPDRQSDPRSRAQIERALAQGYRPVQRGRIGRDAFVLYENIASGAQPDGATH